MSYFDQILISEKFKSHYRPDGVLHLGGRITSKRWYQYIDKLSLSEYVMVSAHPLRNDPLHNVSLRIESGVEEFATALLPEIKEKSGTEILQLQKLSEKVEKILNEWETDQKNLSEISISRLISQAIPKENALFLASSMPIRDMDMYAVPGGSPVSVASNRGASGIDGTVASASGFAVGSQKPVTLLIGDLALLHDLNSLALLPKLAVPVVTVVINNDGGGIFSFLPIAKFEKTFEEFFGTPHGLNFEGAAKMFGLTYSRPETSEAFCQNYREALKVGKPALIEVRTQRKLNYKTHQILQAQITRVVDKHFQK